VVISNRDDVHGWDSTADVVDRSDPIPLVDKI